MRYKVPGHEMKFRFATLTTIALALVVISMGSIAMVFAGFHAFRWLAYFLMPIGAIFVMFCAALAMAGKIEKG